MEALRRLGDRLDVIETALAVALEEPEPEHRGRLLSVLDHAAAAARAEHQEAESAEEKRSFLHLVKGGCCSSCLIQESSESGAPAARWTDQTRDHARTSAR